MATTIEGRTRRRLSGGAVLLLTVALALRLLRRLRRRKRLTLPLLAVALFAGWKLAGAIGTPEGWIEARGSILGADPDRAQDPFRRWVVRFEDGRGRTVDFLDAAAIDLLERGGEAALDVPVLYDPREPGRAMIALDGRWREPARMLAGCLALLAVVLALPGRRPARSVSAR
ncbi:MAG: hypothetical protein KDE35_16790 [Geminicoccaceae bacterium]|nr:hypothetical protein [Geminicoccaceae bacterium]